MRKVSTEDFIAKAREVHGDKYDYSKTEYSKAKAKICIICPEHGEFWQTPDSHLRGAGCPKCAGNVQMTREVFVLRAREVHGDKYDYSKVEYVNSSTKVCIICPEHGEFWQTPNKHLSGQGCPKCLGKEKTTEQFITEAYAVHGDKYDYSKVEYVNSSTKVCIICPEHGEWYTLPGNFLKGYGCPKCGQERSRKASIKWTKDSFIAKAREIHGEKYFYSKVDYSDLRTKVCIICPEHGEFWQSPIGHLRGKGCPRCGGRVKLTTDEFIAKAREVHGDKYDYSKVNYSGVDTKVCIICPVHGEFWQTPAKHMKGQGCPKCSTIITAEKTRERTMINSEEFIAKARAIHGDKYDYSKVNYVNSSTKVCIICPEHGEFWMLPSNHFKGQGCPRCSFPNKHLTAEEFFTQAREVHGDKYDYSKVEYTNAITKVCIVCPIHGEFWKTPSEHLNGMGCPKCNKLAMALALTKTTEWFISRAREVHGDKYDYSKVEYVKANKKVCIICPIHGEFWQTPNGHLGGRGCPKCGGRVKLTTDEFIARAREVHGDKYDYSKVEYVKANKKVCIICPEHGEFYQSPIVHVRGGGCPRCKAPNRNLTLSEFIEKARLLYGDKYDYSKINWDSITNLQKSRITIICPIHGEFEQRPYDHLTGCGCPNCSGLRKEYKLSLLTQDDIQRAPTDNRFFCLTGLEIFALIKAGVLSKDFMSIARTPRGSRARLDAIQTLVNTLSTNAEDNTESIDEEALEVDSIETLEEIERVDEDNTDLIIDETTGLPVLDSHENILRNGDIRGIDSIDPTSENGKFIVVNTINKWWQVLCDDDTFIDKIRNYYGSKFYDYIKEEFFKEYNAVMDMENPEGYNLKFDLYPYQKLFGYRLSNRDSYSNWCDMGAGKTYSCLFASRYNGLKNNIVIAPKSVLQESWVSSIYDAFPDSKVIAFFGEEADEFKVSGNIAYNKWLIGHLTIVHSISEFPSFEDGYNYLLVNYDKFSQTYAKELVEKIVEKCSVDYVILDEIQKVKYRESTGEVSERNKYVTYLLGEIRATNENVKVSALSGAPLINELSEVKSIVELTTGEEVTGIKSNRINISNVSEANKAIVLNGFRYRPEINVKHVLLTPEIECSEELERTIRRLANQRSYYGELESALAIEKINSPEVIYEIKPGTIIYTLFPYKNNTASEIIRKVESLGFKVGAYLGNTPNRHEVFEDFVNGKTDVLVASSPISVGVDGLQNRSNRMIIISLPQTNADFEQLIKRIIRKRKETSVLKVKDVTIIVPQIVLKLNESDDGGGSEWSWDRSRMNALFYKRNLGDAVMDGDIQKVFRIDWNKLYQNAMDRFRTGIKDEVEIQKRKIVAEVPKEERVVHERAVSVINETHRLANSSNHGTTHRRFIDAPEAFQEYHRARELTKRTWIEDPVDYLAIFINEHYSNKKIADLGCGTNKLSSLMKNGNTVKGFDHQQVEGHDEVIIADIANLCGHVEDREMDIAIFCLSLWGLDYEDYFKEAHRILKNGGRVIVVEPSDDFGEGKRYGEETTFINIVEKYGFYRLGGVVRRNNFTYFRFIKED